MNAETSTTPFPTSAEQGEAASSGANGLNGDMNRVRKVAQTLHEAVDALEQKIGTGSDKMMNLQQEYGEIARDQVRANPLAALGVAFAVGYVFARVFSR